jgi:transcriptional regulator with XRE-family HTH domain
VSHDPCILRDWRERHGLTQKAAAQGFGVVANTVARWERGELAIPHWVPLLIAHSAYTSRIATKVPEVPQSDKPRHERYHKAEKERLISTLSHVSGLCLGMCYLHIPTLRAVLTADERQGWIDHARESSQALWAFAEKLSRYTGRIQSKRSHVSE